mgnify:CR=1 FL=1
MKSTAVLTCVLAGLLAACSQADPATSGSTATTAATAARGVDAHEAEDLAAMQADPRLVVVHKTETCGCCHLWVQHMRDAGFQVTVRDVVDMGPIKERVGVPYGMGSCHTARVGGYFIEGHVPAADVARLLEEQPEAKGLTVPGMPLGSPGMEVASGDVQPYDVHLVARDGSTSVFVHHGD